MSHKLIVDLPYDDCVALARLAREVRIPVNEIAGVMIDALFQERTLDMLAGEVLNGYVMYNARRTIRGNINQLNLQLVLAQQEDAFNEPAATEDPTASGPSLFD